MKNDNDGKLREKIEDGAAKWTRGLDGEWCVLKKGARLYPGDEVVVEKTDGTSKNVIVESFILEDELGTYYRAEDGVRADRAKDVHLISIDMIRRNAEFLGPDGEVYKTTLTRCTCPEYKELKTPCKHIYKLRDEVIIMHPAVTNRPVKKRWPVFAGALIFLWVVGMTVTSGGDPRPAMAQAPVLAAEMDYDADIITPVAATAYASEPIATRRLIQEPAQKISALAPALFGETLEVEPGLFLTVNGVRTTVEGLFDADGVYVVFDCTYENRSVKTNALSTLVNLSVKDEDGWKYDAALWAKTRGPLDGSLAAGDTVRGEVAFDVPIGTVVAFFTYEPFWVEGFSVSQWRVDLQASAE